MIARRPPLSVRRLHLVTPPTPRLPSGWEIQTNALRKIRLEIMILKEKVPGYLESVAQK